MWFVLVFVINSERFLGCRFLRCLIFKFVFNVKCRIKVLGINEMDFNVGYGCVLLIG